MWTNDQKECITLRGEDILVSASAGSGKTSVMIERIVGLLKEGALLSEMAVCTFTVSAAADMKAKLSKRLKAEGGMAAQLAYLPQADISTLHSFCQRIIRTYFYAADVDPAFEIADDAAAQVMLEEAVGEAVAQELEAGDADFLRLYSIFLSGRKDVRLREMLTRLYTFAAVQPSPEQWLENCLSGCDRHAEYAAELQGRAEAKRAALKTRAEELYYRLCQAEAPQKELDCAQNLILALSEGAEQCVLPRAKADAQYIALHEELKELRQEAKSAEKQLAEWLSAADGALARPYGAVLVRLALTAYRKFSQAKKRRALCDFNDLEHLMLEILRSPAGEAVRAKYKYVFVDEYQDINPLQECILRALGGSGFFVGDIKQSIYSFRMCTPEIFAARKSAYAAGAGRCVELSANFRSDEQILQLCNRVFGGIMTAAFGGVDYDGSARFTSGAGRLFSPSVNAYIVLSPKREKPKAEGVYSVRGRERGAARDGCAAQAQLIAAHVAELLLKSVPEGGGTRPVEPGDIAVLVRSRTRLLKELAKAFKRLGIPFCLADNRPADQSPATVPLINFLRLLDNRADDVTLAAVALQFFGFTDDELAQVRLGAEKAAHFHEAFFELAAKGDGADASSPAARAANMARTLDFYASLDESASSVAGRIAADFELFLRARALSDGAETLSDFLDEVAACPYNASVSQYVAFIGKKMPALSGKSGAGGVKLGTVHGSKGLEYPFVVLADTQSRFDVNDAGAEMLLSEKYGLSLKAYDYDAGSARATAQYLLAGQEKRKKQLEEEMRILYVALTRARLSLSIFGVRRQGGGESRKNAKAPESALCLLDWLEPYLQAEYVAEEDCYFIDDAPKMRPVFSAPDLELKALIAERLAYEYPYPPVRLKTTVTALAAKDDDYKARRELGVFSDGGESAPVTADEGTAYHLFMQTAAIGGEFEREFGRFTADFPAAARLVSKRTAQTAYAFLSGVVQGKTAYREQPFVIKTDEGTLVQGIIDLLLTDGQTAEIIDFKTVPYATLGRPSYKMQVQLYARAVEKLLGLRVVSKRLYSILDGRTLEV